MASTGIRVVVSDEGQSPATMGLSRWLARVAPARARGTVNVALMSDARVRALNRRYRRRDSATDVLSFGCVEPSIAKSVFRSKITKSKITKITKSTMATPCLGDIVIARGVARRQAREAGHDERTELRILALHGLLHLLGYDHHRDNGLMARAERRLRRKGGLREGLIERSWL
jgi:probable rRNA maturation factor